MIDDTDEVCYTCNEGRLRPQVDKAPVEYKGQTAEVDLHHSVCDVCGIDLANNKQINLNAKNMVIFCKKVDGHLSGEEIRAIRERLGLSQEEASRVFKGGSIPFHKYEEDQKEHSPETDRLLRQAAQNPEAFMQAPDDKLAAPPYSSSPGSHVLPGKPTSSPPMPG